MSSVKTIRNDIIKACEAAEVVWHPDLGHGEDSEGEYADFFVPGDDDEDMVHGEATANYAVTIRKVVSS